MSKQLDERFVGDYPGLTRTIQVFDDNTIEIEFNFPYSNEIGRRFRKNFINWEDEVVVLKNYIENSTSLAKSEFEQLEELAIKSNLKLAKDIINDGVLLPDEFYYYCDGKDSVTKWLNYVDPGWKG